MAGTAHDSLFDDAITDEATPSGEGEMKGGVLKDVDLLVPTTPGREGEAGGKGDDCTDRGGHQPKLEFFDEKLAEEEGAREGALGSLGRKEGAGEEDSGSEGASRGFVTLSPLHEDKTEEDVLLPLDDSTSSGDIPKSKLDDTPPMNRWEAAKRLDLETAVAGPGRKRNISPPASEVEFVDLKVSITDREKQGTKGDSFIMYKICTESTLPTHVFQKSDYEVWRRYKDFEWLRDLMEKTHTTLIVPPIPGKQLTRYFDHMSEEFLKERQKALEKFLWRLAVHPFFSFDKHFNAFLTLDPEDFAAYVAETTSGRKLMEMVSTSVKNASTSFRLKAPEPEFAKQAKYFAELSEKVSSMERVATRLHSEREVLGETIEDFSSAIFQWAGSENQMQQPLQRVVNCSDHCGAALKKLNEANAYSLLMSMKEYQLYCSSALSVLKRRDALQLEKERMAEDRERKKKAHDDAVSGTKAEHKIAKLADELEKAGIGAERALDEVSQANEQLRVDVEKWHEAKNRELSQLMRQVADNHITYHQKCFKEWEVVLRVLKNLKSVEKGEQATQLLLEDSEDPST